MTTKKKTAVAADEQLTALQAAVNKFNTKRVNKQGVRVFTTLSAVLAIVGPLVIVSSEEDEAPKVYGRLYATKAFSFITAPTDRLVTVAAGAHGAAVQLEVVTVKGVTALYPPARLVISVTRDSLVWADYRSVLEGNTSIRDRAHIGNSLIIDSSVTHSSVQNSIIRASSVQHFSSVSDCEFFGDVIVTNSEVYGVVVHAPVEITGWDWTLHLDNSNIQNIQFILAKCSLDVNDTKMVVDSAQGVERPLITEQDHWKTIGNVGQANDQLLAVRGPTGNLMFARGCFYGDYTDFVAQVKDTRRGHTKATYLAAAEFAKATVVVKSSIAPKVLEARLLRTEDLIAQDGRRRCKALAELLRAAAEAEHTLAAASADEAEGKPGLRRRHFALLVG